MDQLRGVQSGTKIPIVDLEKLAQLTNDDFNDEDIEIRRIAYEFGKALHETGFVYLVNHGIDQKIISNAFIESMRFFDLPTELKMKLLKSKETAATNFHGYVPPGNEVLKKDGLTEEIKVEKKEAFDIFLKKYRKYPTEDAPTFQGALEAMEACCKKLDRKLLKLLTFSIGLENTDFFINCAKHLTDSDVPTRSIFRTLYYPPIPIDQNSNTEKKGKKYIGCNEHTDWCALTLLFQDSVGGLEVQTKEGKWIPATPVPNTIVVNTGDLLEAWTGGYFKATPHRVRVLQTEEDSMIADEQKRELKSSKQSDGFEIIDGPKSVGRQSIAYFMFPDDDVVVSPIQSDFLLQKCGQQFIKPLSAYDHFYMKASEAQGNY